jgi:3-phytase/alkaline phosphatase D
MRYADRWLLAALCCIAGYVSIPHVVAAEGTVRVATYNTSLFRNQDGQLIRDLRGGNNPQARRIAEVIQRVRPDIVLLNEFDYDAEGQAAKLFRTNYLSVGRDGGQPIDYPHHFVAPVNTGRPSGRDLNKDGQLNGPADSIGFGRHEGQYGMLVLSRFPIDQPGIRTFQNFLWRDMPGAMLPGVPESGRPFFDEEDLAVQRLSSKSFWDVPINVPARDEGKAFTLHLLCSHPTPPVFDGPEDRNGRRNHDEVRLVADYIDASKSDYLEDDAGKRGGLANDSLFVIVGDLNCDPVDGQGVRGTMDQLLKNPRVNAEFTPKSVGGKLTVQQHADQHTKNRGNPEHVTSNFTGEGHGCLRIDYALPSKGLSVADGGVFWPPPGEPGSEAVSATDHRMVWIDVRPDTQ